MLAGIAIYLLICLLIFVPAVKKIKNRSIRNRDYLVCILKSVFLCAFVIMMLELVFDHFIIKEPANIFEAIIIAFGRAALIEETVKYLFVRKIIKKYQPASKIEYILLAATVGIGYGFSEKLVMGSGIILIVNAVIPLHMFFQMMMGQKLFEYHNSNKKSALLLAFVKPFFLHGLWDSILFSCEFLLSDEMSALSNGIGVAVLLICIVITIILEVKTVRKLYKEN